MKISDIRSVIQSAAWVRRDLSGHTREEFNRRDVPTVLSRYITELRSLEIHPRFVREIEQRNEAIRYCEELGARWNLAHQTPVLEPASVN
jgi:hypothetical protein